LSDFAIIWQEPRN